MSRRFDSEAEVPAVWEPGDVLLGLYEVLGVAGQGGMGVVYRVRHREWDVELAVKCPKPGALGSEAGRAAFVAEAQTWIDLGLHRHVCACHYVRVLGGIPRLFAEYLEGGSLADWVSDRRLYAGGPAVALERMLGLSLALARGLAYAHARDLVHQDVKPANLLVGADGVGKVADFGIARAAGAPARGAQAGTAPSAAPDSVLGDPRVSLGGMTQGYRSPEQARARAAVAGGPSRVLTAATDVWSLAVSVLELLIGDLPSVDGQAAGEALGAFLARGPEDPAIPPAPGALIALLGRCLCPEPSERPAMAQVAGELADIYTEQTGSPAPQVPAQDARLLAGELSNRALSLVDLGQPEEAERAWEEALAQDPHHVEATYNQGLHQWRSAAIADDELVRRLEAVRASHQRDWHDEHLLALVHLERGDPVAAEELLAAAQAQGGQSPQLTAARQQVAAVTQSARELPTLEHAGNVKAVALTPDGRLALTGSDDGTARLWEIASGRCLRTLEGHTDVCSVAISADGRLALTGGMDGTARQWELASGRCLRIFGEHTHNTIHSFGLVALTPDGRLALTASWYDSARLWELASGRCLRTLEGHASRVTSVALTPDGRLALIGGKDEIDGVAWLWELATGRCLRTLKGPTLDPKSVPMAADGQPRQGPGFQIGKVTVESVALTPDGRLALTAGSDPTARLWELASGRCLRTLEGHTGWVESVALTPDGRLALTGAGEGPARMWELASGRCLRTLERHTGRVRSVALTPDGRVALTSIDGTARLWELHPAGAAFAYVRPRPTGEAAVAEAGMREVLAEVDRLTGEGSLVEAAGQLRSLRQEPGYERDPAVLEQWRKTGRKGRRAGLLAMWPRQELEQFGPVMSVALTPDGRLALTGGFDEVVRLWELSSGRCLRTLEGHTVSALSVPDARPSGASALSVALTPDGRLALTGGEDGTARLWELDSGRCLHTLEGDTSDVSYVTSVVLTPDGRLALTAKHGTARVWDLSSGRCLRTLEGRTGRVRSVALTPDGRLALTGSKEGHVQLWELASGRCLRTLEGHTHRVESVALTPDGRLALTGSDDRTARLWDLSSGRCLRTLEGHTNFDYFSSVAISADGRVGLTGSGDSSPRLWELAGGRCLRTLERHTGRVRSVALTPDGRLAFTVSHDGGTARLWELDWDYEFPEPADWDEGARPLLEAFLHAQVPYADPLTEEGPLRRGAPAWGQADFETLLHKLEDAGYGWLRPEGVRRELEGMATQSSSVRPSGRRGAVSDSGAVSDPAEIGAEVPAVREVDDVVLEHSGPVGSVALTPDGRLALTGGFDKVVRLWQLSSGRCLRTLEGHTDYVWSVAISADGQLALTLGVTGASPRLWDLSTGRCLRTLEGTMSVALTPDGRLALTGGGFAVLTPRLWELESGRCLRALEGHAKGVTSVALTPDGGLALTGSRDKTARLWDVESGRCLRTLEGHSKRVYSVALTPDGRLALTGSKDKTARLWELANGRCLRTLEHAKDIHSVALTPDGRLALTGSKDKTARLWELASGRCLRTLEGHAKRVRSVALTPDGGLALTGSDDGTARLWTL